MHGKDERHRLAQVVIDAAAKAHSSHDGPEIIVQQHDRRGFPRQRADPHAQDEIRVYVEAIARVVADWMPLAYAAFEDYRMGGVTLSSKAVDCVRRMLKGEVVTQETSGMSKGEWREFEGVLG